MEVCTLWQSSRRFKEMSQACWGHQAPRSALTMGDSSRKGHELPVHCHNVPYLLGLPGSMLLMLPLFSFQSWNTAGIGETLTDDLPAFSLTPLEYISNVRASWVCSKVASAFHSSPWLLIPSGQSIAVVLWGPGLGSSSFISWANVAEP